MIVVMPSSCVSIRGLSLRRRGLARSDALVILIAVDQGGTVLLVIYSHRGLPRLAVKTSLAKVGLGLPPCAPARLRARYVRQHIHASALMHPYGQMLKYVHRHMCKRVNARIYTQAHAHMYTHAHIRAHSRMHTHIHTCAHIHTDARE